MPADAAEKVFALALPVLLGSIGFRFYLMGYFRRSDLSRAQKVWMYANCGIYIVLGCTEVAWIFHFVSSDVATTVTVAAFIALLCNMLAHAIWVT